MKKVAVVAIGGNSLIKSKDRQTIPDQFIAVKETCAHIATMIKHGYDVIITHGNGPKLVLFLEDPKFPAANCTKYPLITAELIRRAP